MQLGFVSAIFPDLSLDHVFEFAALEGFDCVEVMCWPPGGPDRAYGGVCHIDCSEFTQAMADDVRALCEKHGVAISALGYYSVPLSAQADQAEAAQAHLHKVIDAAPMLGLGGINSFVGANQTLNLEDNFKLFEEVWPGIVRHAEERGVRIGIENCPMLYEKTWPFGLNLARSPAIWRRMFEIIPSPNFGLNYDPSHLRMQLMDPIAPIREFGPRIFHTHAKDMRIDVERLNDVGSLVPPMDRGTAKIPGLGDIDWGKWIGALTDAGFDGPVCIEVEDEAFTETLDRRKQSLRISRNVLRPLIA
ncbi:Inosose dehydratase [Pirellulimonas nuda]|uniref:Inosose dehydratase n=1 Tax=Pirellulimonas nuda TaxID=2528009 RepID=A0A518DF92_9BACT|nr:sugar phosphate isomerase/epimerase [Pirellulimonas nuda]QDU90147.1 Inosose dehydratase [Pirellulimonas nuda]